MADKNKGGRPPTYKTVDEMQEKIESYFEECNGKLLKIAGEIVYNKNGDPVIVKTPPTVTGLALHLGFNTRLALLNYQAKDEFVNAITRAKARIEQYAETRLYDKDGCNGAKFTLINNFGHAERIETTNHNLNQDLTTVSPEERNARIDELLNKRNGIG